MAVGAAGIPVNVGLADKTVDPVPVDDVTPVPPLATGSVPVVPPSIGRPVQFVRVPDAGVPSAGLVNVGLVNVGLVNVLLVSVWLPVNVTTVESMATVTAAEPL